MNANLRRYASPINLPRLPATIGSPAVAALLLALAATAALLITRRLSGALETPLTAAAMFALATTLTAFALAARLLSSPTAKYAVLRWAPLPFLVAIGVAVSLPETPVAGLLLFWSAIALEETGSLALLPRLAKRELALAENTSRSLPSSSLPLEEPVSQQYERSVENDCDTIRGRLRTRFEAGQRTATCHLAFCPPLAAAPELQFSQVSGPAARIKAGQLLAFGVRFELKLTEPVAEPRSVLLEFTARCPQDQG